MKLGFNRLLLFVNCVVIQGYNSLHISEEDYHLLPKVFNFNETENLPESWVICSLSVNLSPVDDKNPPRVWNLIEQIREDNIYYNRDEVYHVMYFHKGEKLNFERMEQKYLKQGFTTHIKKTQCYEKKSFSEFVRKHDIIFFVAYICYFIFVIYCSVRSIKTFRPSHQTKLNNYMELFSIPNTWKNIRKHNKNEDFNNLLSIQGVRTISSTLVIITHCYFFNISRFSHNPEYIENILANPLKQLYIGSFGLLVQIFFMISAWLLAVQLHKLVEKNGQIGFIDIFNLAVKRYFRLLPMMITALIMENSTLIHYLIVQPLYYSSSMVALSNCSKNWWRNLLLIQNIGESVTEMCCVETWYLASDTQMYIIILFLFYLSLRTKIDMKYVLGVTVGVAMLFQAHTVMTTDFGALAGIDLRFAPLGNVLFLPEFTISYIRTICNIATYAIGFTFGTIYYKNKNRVIFNTPIKKLFWYFFFLGIPVLITALTLPRSQNNSRGIELLMSLTFRPLFSLSIAIGILGMATKTGGLVKRVLELKPLVFFGDFTYSVYMFHMMIVIGRMLTDPKMATFTDSDWVINSAINVVLSFLVGILMYVVVEYPWMQLQQCLISEVGQQNKTLKMKDN